MGIGEVTHGHSNAKGKGIHAFKIDIDQFGRTIGDILAKGITIVHDT